MSQTAIRCSAMRGGTSKGLVFLAGDLPADTATRDAVLLAAMGSPDPRQVDGIGLDFGNVQNVADGAEQAVAGTLGSHHVLFHSFIVLLGQVFTD